MLFIFAGMERHATGRLVGADRFHNFQNCGAGLPGVILPVYQAGMGCAFNDPRNALRRQAGLLREEIAQ